MSLHTLSKTYGSKSVASLGETSRSLGSSSYAPTAGGQTYEFANGTTFRSTSGVPPTQYKAWSSEYSAEFRSAPERKATLQALTVRHDTANALSRSRYQFQGYPNHTTNPAFKTQSPSSLTARGQIMPNYETTFSAF
ncbi:hypothetical protein FOA52_006300 [Chlamydomonas sp. UWO 241]|nr:hypothetical protein FOA52_006300 [Chlamydomonas sp. UWO 241]